MVRGLAFVVTLLLAVCVATVPVHVAHAQEKQSVKSLLKKAQNQYDEQEYEQSIQVLSAALMRPGIDKREKIEVYRLLAYNYIVLQRDEESDGAVRGLLVLDPSFSLPDTESPRFRDFFDKVQKTWEEEGRPGFVDRTSEAPGSGSNVKVKHTSPAQVDPGASISLEGEVNDPDAIVSKVKLYYRKGTEGKFKTARVKYAVRKFSVEIPSSVVEPPLVEYYLEALDETGLPVATRGDAASPLRVAVTDDGSVLTSPWLWVPVGVTVVAAVVIVAVVASSSGESAVTVSVFE